MAYGRKKGILTKLEHLEDARQGSEKFANFKTLEVIHVEFYDMPKKAHRFEVASEEKGLCSFSPIQKFLNKTKYSVTFKTFNSIYRLDLELPPKKKKTKKK